LRPTTPARAGLAGRFALLAVALSGLTACATPGGRGAAAQAGGPGGPTAPGKPANVQFAPEEVQVSRLDLELAGKNDEELFAVGMAAYGAKDWARAATAFARIADRFPGSRHEATALFDAGLAYEQLSEWRLALERFHALVRGWEGPDALEASFKVAECHYHLGDLSDAHATLTAVAAQPGLAPALRVRALAQLGVVELEDDKPEEAERTLRRALAAFTVASEGERLDPYFAAQAEYYLGEVYRAWFLEVPFDPSRDDDRKLGDALEQKSNLLLTAQGHYLRSIRLGDHTWAVASGSRVGELYDGFRKQLLDAPLPPELDEEHQQAYRDELRRRVRVLAAKAITAYEAALGRASVSGVTDEDVKTLADARQALQRLEEALREDPGAGM
jgi:tetratricopeptide (TPR) repeat protein